MQDYRERDAFILYLYEQHHVLVEKTCWSKVYHIKWFDDLVQGCIQEVWIDATRDYAILRNHPNIEGWLVTAATHNMIDALRKHSKREAKIVCPLSESMLDMKNGIDRWHEYTQQKETITQIRAALTEKERPLFDQFYVEGHSVNEIAQGRGVSVSAITSALHRLRKKVMSSLENFFTVFLLLCVTFQKFMR